MELITSGILSIPETLTLKAIYAMCFHEYDKIKDTLFVLQVIGIKKLD